MKRAVAATSRRGIVTAAAAAGMVVAAARLPRPGSAARAGAPAQVTNPAGAEGYRLTEHIQRYYRTTLV